MSSILLVLYLYPLLDLHLFHNLFTCYSILNVAFSICSDILVLFNISDFSSMNIINLAMIQAACSYIFIVTPPPPIHTPLILKSIMGISHTCYILGTGFSYNDHYFQINFFLFPVVFCCQRSYIFSLISLELWNIQLV